MLFFIYFELLQRIYMFPMDCLYMFIAYIRMSEFISVYFTIWNKIYVRAPEIFV